MFLKDKGLILEGGGLRGIYTAGVLDCFLKNKVEFPYVIGVSAGACMGYSYVARQFGRDKKIILTYRPDHRYFSIRNLIKEGNIFSRDFLYNQIPNKLVPFDYTAFKNSLTKFITVATDCVTGMPVYFDKDHSDIVNTLAASASLPFVNKMIKYDGKKLLDGGITDSIPLRQAIRDGYEKNVVVLTRPRGYRKGAVKLSGLIKIFYKNYPKLAEAILKRSQVYNETMDLVEKLEEQKKVLVIRPSQNLKVGRIEKNLVKLEKQYELGFQDAQNLIKNVLRF